MFASILRRSYNSSSIFSSKKGLIKELQLKMSGLPLEAVVKALEDFAPSKVAESWDNVGLLIEPHTPKPIKRIFLTNDLTEPVLEEAVAENSDLIISYHPPIFAPLKRITQKNWKERLVSICLENRIALYSPHTSWDFVPNGVTDWLASALLCTHCEPIKLNPDFEGGGIGRVLTIPEGITLKCAIERVKEKIKMKDVRVALGKNVSLESTISKVGICAGSGFSVLKDLDADLYLTGEMSHHEVLDATQRNISVILCNHSNSERGYLEDFEVILSNLLNAKEARVNIIISKKDADPLITC